MKRKPQRPADRCGGTKLIATLDRDYRTVISAARAALGEERFDDEHCRGAALGSADVLDLALEEATPA